MDMPTARQLTALTNCFYEEAAASFSATREQPWPGWKRLSEAYGDHLRTRTLEAGKARLLDLACGNLRFERFLGDALPDARVKTYAVDDCLQLVDACEGTLPANVYLTYQQMDIMQALERSTLTADLACEPCDLSVAFGFMHHIPVPAWRTDALQALIEHTARDGLIAVSFWQFLDDERLREKADEATARGCTLHGIAFDNLHDRLLGWQDRDDIFRYCHHFSEDEIDHLIGSLSDVREIDRFSADGRSDLNRYVLLQRE